MPDRVTSPLRVRFDIGAGGDLVIGPVIESAAWLGYREDETVTAVWGLGPFIAGSTASADFPNAEVPRHQWLSLVWRLTWFWVAAAASALTRIDPWLPP